MCQILYKPANAEVNEDKFISSFNNNSDGFGYSYVEDGKIKTKKKLGLTDTQAYDIATGLLKEKAALIHMRFKTAGEVSTENIHPFNVLKEDGYSMVMAHNGTIHDFKEAKSTASDTKRFVKAIVHPLAKTMGMGIGYDNVLTNPLFRKVVQEYVGTTYNRVAFFDSEGRCGLVNKELWVEDKGVLWANSYSFNDSHRKPTTYQPYTPYTYTPPENKKPAAVAVPKKKAEVVPFKPKKEEIIVKRTAEDRDFMVERLKNELVTLPQLSMVPFDDLEDWVYSDSEGAASLIEYLLEELQ